MNILIVEDDSEVASVLNRSLAASGHKAEQAATCSEALRKVRLFNFDLILLDLFLPDGMGYELIPQLKALDPGPVIITMTAKNSRELETIVRRQGILFYLIKPFEFKYLENILEHRAGSEKTRAEESKEQTGEEQMLFDAPLEGLQDKQRKMLLSSLVGELRIAGF